MHLLKNNKFNNLNFNTDLYFQQNFFQIPIYFWRRRFKILGMGFHFHLTVKNTILISNGKTHPLEIKNILNENEKFLPKIKGYKNRILLIRLQNTLKLTNKILQNIYNKIKPNYYRRKGIGCYNDTYKYKKGKKKFI